MAKKLYRVSLDTRTNRELMVLAEDFDDAALLANNQWVEWGYTRAEIVAVDLVAIRSQYPPENTTVQKVYSLIGADDV